MIDQGCCGADSDVADPWMQTLRSAVGVLHHHKSAARRFEGIGQVDRFACGGGKRRIHHMGTRTRTSRPGTAPRRRKWRVGDRGGGGAPAMYPALRAPALPSPPPTPPPPPAPP